MYAVRNITRLQCIACIVLFWVGSDIRAEKLAHRIGSEDINPTTYVQGLLQKKDTISVIKELHSDIREQYYDNLDQAKLLAIQSLELAKSLKDPDIVIESHIVYNNTIVDNMDEYFINSLVQLSSFNEAEILTNEQIFTFYKSYSYYLLRNAGISQAHNTCIKYLAFVNETEREDYAAQVYYRLGQLYSLYNNKKLCYEYFDKSIDKSIKTDQSHYLKLAIINKAMFALDLNDIHVAKKCLQKIELDNIIEDDSKLLFKKYLQIIKLRISILEGDHTTAKFLLDLIELDIESVGSSTIHCQYFKSKAEYFMAVSEHEKAYDTYVEALDEMKPYDQINFKIFFIQKIRDCSLLMENINEAYKFSMMESDLRDSLEKKNIEYKLANLQKQDVNSTNKIIKLKKERTHFQAKALKRNRQLLLFVSISFLSFLLYSSFINKRRTTLLNRLQVQNEELSNYFHSNTELKQFTAIAAHDLKSPLRTISNFAALLRRKLGANLKPSEEEHFDMIESNAKKLSHLIDGLMSLNKLDASGLIKESVNINQLLSDVLNNLDFQISSTKAEVTLPENEISIQANSILITQVLQNVISNAIKFSSKNQIPNIKIKSEQTETSSIIKIEDNGIGVHQDFKENIFKSFEKYHAESEYEGSGLGLSICRKIIENHNGKIGIEDNHPRGTIVWFSLPNE